MGVASQQVTIVNKKGLHARASGEFARLAGTFVAEVTVAHEDEVVNGNHIMDLLMLVAHRGCTIEIRAEGSDADTAVASLAALVADGFGELSKEAEEGASGGDPEL